MPICRQQNLCGCVAFTKVRLKGKPPVNHV